jgi:uncharacterized protein (DUF1810 family)
MRGMASNDHGLRRFIDAQAGVFETALAELNAGAKCSHWMWFIFPQLAGLGRSPTAEFYAISSLAEARGYLADVILGPRLRQSVEAVLPWAARRSAEQIFGSVDAMKFRSSLTLFDRAAPADLFAAALAAFFAGEPDQRTLALIGSAR